jgi:16S rRNA processing protein RimM
VLRPHALKGELRVAAFSPAARNIQRGRPVYLGGIRRVVLRARKDREAWILKLEGLDDRAAVESTRGELLETPDREILRDDDESYFVHELIGLRVLTDAGAELGNITDVLQSGAADVYVVRGAVGETLLPAIGEVIERIDVVSGTMTVRPQAGLEQAD